MARYTPSDSTAKAVQCSGTSALTVLLTGFDAFGGATVNSSGLAVQALHTRLIAGHCIVASLLPTTFEVSLAELMRLLHLHKPDLVICVGQAGGRSAISIERVAINLQDASMADNAGVQPLDCPVVPGGPAAYFSTLPVKAMLHALTACAIPAEISHSAGTFVCNHVFYALMHAQALLKETSRVRGGFIHVPWLPEQGTPCMTLEGITAGLHCAIKAALTADIDID